MRSRLLFVLMIALAAFTSASAQNNRTVTNEDLEKYRQKRLAAERDYRENYERMGFPSPEELEKQIEQNRVERGQLAARLEAEKLRRDQLNLERERAEAEARRNNQQYQTNQPDYFSNFGYGGFLSFPNYGGYYNRGYRGGFYGNYGNYRRGNFNNQPRVEYRNNLPVIVPPAPPRIAVTGSGRRN